MNLTARLDADAARAQHIQRVRGPFTSGDDTAWLLARLGERDAALRAVLRMTDESIKAQKRLAEWGSVPRTPVVIAQHIRAAVVSALSGGAE